MSFGDPFEFTRRRVISPIRSVRISSLLIGLLVGTYLLVLLGIVAGVTDAVSTCRSWPICSGAEIGSVDSAGQLIALGHRLAAGTVGIALAAVWICARRRAASVRVQRLLSFVVGLYALQIGIGAMIVLGGPTRLSAALHLLVGMTVFWGLLVGFVWRLEDEFGHVLDGAFVEATEEGQSNAHTESNRAGTILPTPVGAYLELMKPRLMWLLALVALAGIALTGDLLNALPTAVATVFGGALAIGASGTFNNVLERDRDRRMRRTEDRPIATETVSITNAIAFGTLLAITSMVVFVAFVNVVAATLALLAILFYSVVYTLVLKPHTTQNVVIGGIVGAIPALIGWAAITGTIGLPAILLGTVIFLWTPAHFYNLALAYRADYARAGFPMLTVVDGERKTVRHIGWYFGATMLAVGVLAVVSEVGVLFVAAALAVSGIFLAQLSRLYRNRTRSAALRSFHASNAYLGVLLVVIVLEVGLL